MTRPGDSPIFGAMIRLLPILLLVLGLFAMTRFSAWQSGRSLRNSSRPLRNDQVESLMGRLARTAGIDTIEVRLLDMPAVNGLATPSGEIYITAGLFKKFQARQITGPELASVVAHELGHLALGHTRRRVIDVTGAQTLHMILGSLLNRFVPVIGWFVARWISTFLMSRMSRKDEFAADAYATALMLRSGLGAEPQVRMLEKLRELVPAAGMQEVSWLASHPPIEERTEAIRANAARWEAKAE